MSDLCSRLIINNSQKIKNMFFKRLSLILGKINNMTIIECVKNGALIVDVRSNWEFSSGSVPGAINIPLEELPQKLTKLKNKKDIVCFCRSGARSGSAKGFLEQRGFKNVHNGGSISNMMCIVNESKE